jgi:CheY-like chemotaxis protein
MKPQILLVDDNNDFRDSMALILMKAGYRVAPAPNGRDALELYEENPADIVVTDLIMPDMEGLELIKELRARTPTAKIIAISGDGRFRPDSYLEFAKRIGASAVLAKPFDPSKLITLIEQLLPPVPPVETPAAP